MDKYIQLFIQHLQNERRLSAHTVLSYQNDLLQFQKFLNTQFEILPHKAQAEHIRSWMVALKEKGIVYAPDYVINAGGIIDIYHQKLDDSSDDAMRAHIAKIGDTLVEVYERAEAENRATNLIANQIAEERFTTQG